MKTQKAEGVTASPSCKRKRRFTLRGRKKKARGVRGKLRMRSMPGAFLVLGIIVVVVGTALAVAGYWPYRVLRSSLLGSGISESQSSGLTMGAKGLISTPSLIHSERMKLLGPVIMGVGLFILICANTVLYENRDRETQMLLAQMRSVICSVSAVVPSADLTDIAAANSMAKHYQWVSSLPAAHLNILCLQQMTSSEPLLQTRTHIDQEDGVEGVYQQAVLHHQESETTPSLHSSHSDSCNSSQTDFNTQGGAGQEDSNSFHAQPPTYVKLNNCLLSASSMSTLGVEEVEVPAAHPRRCHSMSYRTKPYFLQTRVRQTEGRQTPQREEEEGGVTRREAGSQVCVNIPPQVVEATEEHTHSSWPRLDLGSGRRYLKLENKEDSVEKLLDQMEHQCSQWDKSFGSGPFQ
ncbi:transmembrane protein 200A [Labrus bergylta]|uniref:Transmembrane protein 200B n=1 Tax=Labrus bergylta TaxID=56723 RepID=A0A3Q3GFQ3_9LABR|nr:transmembrane protein 200A-like [Labrus bergylta]